MTTVRYILASLRHYRRIHLAVALGVMVAAAVLTGALVVGDSMRESLRALTLQRLGRIDSALVTGHMFRAALADEIAANAEFRQHFTAAEPALLTAGSLQSGSGDQVRRATDVSVFGIRPAFWALGQGGPEKPLADDTVALTESLANELGVRTGERVLLRIPLATAIPADSPLGEKSETALARQLTVAAVLTPDGLARFALAPSQHAPRNAFVPLATLQVLLDQSGKANAIFAATNHADVATGQEAQHALQQALQPRLEDYGVSVEQVETPTSYVYIASDQLVLSDAIVHAAQRAFSNDERQPVVTYLANTLSVGKGESQRKIPYSTITGVDSIAQLGPLLDDAGQPIVLADDEIVLNRWAADDLGASIGDSVTVTFYEPESTHGRLHERGPPPAFKLRAIVDLKSSGGEPTAAFDPQLTPELPGVTDQQSINDWDLPFELVEKIRPQDEEYWDEYRTTPKAFISLAAAKRLWHSRWGTVSLLRLHVGESLRSEIRRGENSQPRLGETRLRVAERLLREIDPAALGMSFLPVKQQGLAAASGTTPFDFLFLGFSFFLMAAAVMLVALLFQLGVEQRVREVGTLSALGVRRKQISTILGREGLVIAAVGAALGVGGGILYAWLMIAGLRTWWVDAIGTPFLQLHATPRSLILGWVIGVAISWLAIRWSIRRLVRIPANRLLAGSVAGAPSSLVGRARGSIWPIARWAVVLIIFAALLFVVIGPSIRSEALAGIFFATGAAVLVLILGEIRWRLRAPTKTIRKASGFSLSRLSMLNIARSPGRSTLTIGLVSAASFLIVAISAFRLETGAAGTGGFELMATSDQPILYDLNTPEGRLELGVSDRPRAGGSVSDEQLLSQCRVYSLRVAAGEDASCLNLYRPTQPTVLGVPDALIQRGGFAWAAAAQWALTNDQSVDSDKHRVPSTEHSGPTGRVAAQHKRSNSNQLDENPWTQLHADLGHDDAEQPIVPVVLDASTAAYSLHLKGIGSRLTIRDAADQPVALEVVGLLKNSILQGNLLISEANFLRLFPDTAGYRFFLIGRHGAPSDAATAAVVPRSPAIGESEEIARVLESTLADDGFDAVSAREQLEDFLAVQNTYLSTFQSLGALGLLLGTIGLAVVQLRSVLERRSELALMRAAGFRRGRLVRMVLWENCLLLVGGLAVGCAAAAVALVPQWLPREASVPWRELALLLAVIAIVGLVAGWLATRSALRAPILPALRGD
jgi:ABC-type antimicrobial peptide transport system permease subunit